MPQQKSILMVVTSHDAIDQNHPTGIWFEEFSIPHALFLGQGCAVTTASPKGGTAPIDPRSLEGCPPSPHHQLAHAALQETRKLDAHLRAADFDAVFFPGGHGAMFDLPGHPEVQRLVGECLAAGKVLAALCHGPACLVDVQLADGTPAVRGRRLTAFTDAEERAVELDQRMPFLLEARLRALGADFVPAAPWQDNVVVDGRLVTGQNPQSTLGAAEAVLKLLST